ncbi:MAG TPA: HTTM domain-containing protein, partial [Polyangiaceae bacterium]|nr:HTTM domain-containing protein [Polyangiaceae bacterium]
PAGWGWLGDLVPLFDRDFATSAQSLFVAATLLTVLGAATRFSAPCSAIVSAYLLGLPNFFAKINHGEHLLVSFCIILAFSRSGDACSVDALVSGARQRRWSLSRTHAPALAYGLPIRSCWLVMGLAYFFPGLYKAWNAGDQWLDGSALLAIAYDKLANLPSFQPTLVIYDSPTLLVFLGASTLLFELGFVFVLLNRRFWWVAPIVGLSFHVGLASSIGIQPWSIVKVYWVFVDFGAILCLFQRQLPKRVVALLGIADNLSAAEPAQTEPAQTEPERAQRAQMEPGWSVSATAAGAVLGLMLFTGLAGIDSFPVAVFPRFDKRIAPGEDLRPSRYMLAIQGPDGEPEEISQNKLPREVRRARWDRILKNLARSGGAERRSKYRSIEELLEQGGHAFERGDRLVLYREYLRFEPETHGRIVEERRMVSSHQLGH